MSPVEENRRQCWGKKKSYGDEIGGCGKGEEPEMKREEGNVESK